MRILEDVGVCMHEVARLADNCLNSLVVIWWMDVESQEARTYTTGDMRFCDHGPRFRDDAW